MEDKIPPRLWQLLRMMHARFKAWAPGLGYKGVAPGFTSLATGKSWDTLQDWEDEADDAAISALESAWDDLGPAGRTAIEMVMGWSPQVYQVRAEVLEDAVKKLVRALQAKGMM